MQARRTEVRLGRKLSRGGDDGRHSHRHREGPGLSRLGRFEEWDGDRRSHAKADPFGDRDRYRDLVRLLWKTPFHYFDPVEGPVETRVGGPDQLAAVGAGDEGRLDHRGDL